MSYSEKNYPDGKGRTRNGSPTFYKLLEEMADTHDSKSHDYASNSNPFGNYLFAGQLSKLFDNSDDAGFVGRIGEKLYRLANLENGGKTPKNELIEDTERDLCVIMALWMSHRRDRRFPKLATDDEINELREKATKLLNCEFCGIPFSHEPSILKIGEIKYYFCRDLCRETYWKNKLINAQP